MEQGKIVSLQLCTQARQPMTFVEEAEALADEGLKGDRHARKGNARQILLAEKETLDALDIKPGTIRENITVQGMELSKIRAGQVFFIGDQVTLEVTGPCLRCTVMDEIRPGLKDELEGRGGVLAVVLNGGSMKVGDTIRVEP